MRPFLNCLSHRNERLGFRMCTGRQWPRSISGVGRPFLGSVLRQCLQTYLPILLTLSTQIASCIEWIVTILRRMAARNPCSYIVFSPPLHFCPSLFRKDGGPGSAQSTTQSCLCAKFVHRTHRAPSDTGTDSANLSCLSRLFFMLYLRGNLTTFLSLSSFPLYEVFLLRV